MAKDDYTRVSAEIASKDMKLDSIRDICEGQKKMQLQVESELLEAKSALLREREIHAAQVKAMVTEMDLKVSKAHMEGQLQVMKGRSMSSSKSPSHLISPTQTFLELQGEALL